MGGDAEHEIWQHIIDNNTDDENLKWNIFMSPHHCSWTFSTIQKTRMKYYHLLILLWRSR